MTSAELRSQARAARAAGNTDEAVAAWRALLDAAPEDWALALELKQDLKAGLHYPDSDPRFRRAARFLPDDAWLAHYSALYAFHGSDLDAIDARAQALLARSPGDARLHAIRGDAARQRRDWGTAAGAFARAARLDPGQPTHAHQAGAAAMYQRLGPLLGSGTGAAYAAHVLNLDRNAERLDELRRQFAASAPALRRIAAVEGARLPSAAVHRLTGDAGAPRGTLGCFLSHAAAWEALLAGSDECALVIEDDVIPLLDLPPRLGALGLPQGWDLVFVNDRLEPRRDPATARGFTTETLAATMRAFDPEDNAPGGDGYLLSRRGARLLLDWTTQDGFAGDVDWRLLAYALDVQAIAAIPAHAHARRELDRLSAQIPRDARLQAHVLHPALIRTVGVSSDREDENRKHAA